MMCNWRSPGKAFSKLSVRWSVGLGATGGNGGARAVYLADLAEVVTPRRRLKVLKDDPDNRILECAVTGKVNVIVTGDQAMLQLGIYRGIRILSSKDFLDAQ